MFRVVAEGWRANCRRINPRRLLLDSAMAIVVSNVIVAFAWLILGALENVRSLGISVSTALESIAGLPFAVVIFGSLALTYIGIPIGLALAAYGTLAQARPTWGESWRWIPASLIVGLMATWTSRLVYGTSWPFFYAGGDRDDWGQSFLLSIAVSGVSFALLVHRLKSRSVSSAF